MRRLAVRTGARVVLVDVASIDWIEAAGDYARVHTARASYLIEKRMHELELELGSREFLRVHRSAIVRLGAIAELHRESDGGRTVILQHGVRLRVARGRWDPLKQALGF